MKYLSVSLISIILLSTCDSVENNKSNKADVNLTIRSSKN